MKSKSVAYITAVLLFGLLCIGVLKKGKLPSRVAEAVDYENLPSEWFFMQRAYPQGVINYAAYDAALEAATQLQLSFASKQDGVWDFIGPTNVGGRLTDVAMHPSDLETIYASAASGGVFKSIDRGLTWSPIFDDQPTLSIGALALDPENPDIVYVGTGEVNGGGGSLTYGGSGVYKSVDGGQSWSWSGLTETRHIGRIAVDPSNPQRLFVAAMGRLFSENEDRGVYRSDDGGVTWEKVLFVSSQTGSVDVAVNPLHPDTVFAAMWQRVRYPDSRMFGGDEGGVFRSIDGGLSWEKLTNGLPETQIGRIGLGISPSEPNILYALYADEIGPFGGFFKSLDGGDSWFRMPDDPLLRQNYATYGWWFGNVRVHPENPDDVFALGLDLIRSRDGGISWKDISGGMHVDHHGLYIHPADTTFMVSGNDGGLYVSTNDGLVWDHANTLPITQFYTVEIDAQDPLHIAGGAQDNNTYHTFTPDPGDWEALFPVGDGQYVRIDPAESQTVYVSFQRGLIFRSIDGGTTFEIARVGIDSSEPVNWSAPIELDPSQSGSLYTGTNRIYRSIDQAASWEPISPVLPLANTGSSIFDRFGTITSIAVAPTNPDYIYAGTDDGLVWVSINGGAAWEEITQSLPQRWITRVMVDPGNENIAYVTLSGFREDLPLPHVFRTVDAGQSWTDISSNLPEVPVNDIIPDALQPGTLYLATDVGVFYTIDDGQSWMPLGSGLPRVPINDLSLHVSSRKLVAATYGRSMFAFDLKQVDRGNVAVESQASEVPNHLDLFENYPNPFSTTTTIRFSLQAPVDVRVELYDVTHRKIATLASGYYGAGPNEVVWDGRDRQGSIVGAGRYYCRIRAGHVEKTRPIIFVP